MEGGGRFHGYGNTSNTNSAPGPGLKQREEKMKQPESSKEVVREQDRFVPVANVIRIMRRMLPSHGKISDDSKEAMQECVSEFILFVTLEANDKCKREQRKTVTAEDILWALGNLGLDNYVEPLTLFLRRYRETEWDRTSVRGEPVFKVPSSTAADLAGASSSVPVPVPVPVMTPSLPVDNMDPLWFLGEGAVGDYIFHGDANANGNDNIGQPKGHYYYK